MFNVMRGGIFADQYWLRAVDFIDFVSARNRQVLRGEPGFLHYLTGPNPSYLICWPGQRQLVRLT